MNMDTIKNVASNADICRSFYFIKYWGLCLSWENINLTWEITYIVCTSPLSAGGGRGEGGWASYQISKIGGAWQGLLDRASICRGGLLGKRGWLFSGGVAIFSTKNKLKSGIFNDKKKVYKQEHFAVVTKNSNWEIFSTNLVTFKR